MLEELANKTRQNDLAIEQTQMAVQSTNSNVTEIVTQMNIQAGQLTALASEVRTLSTTMDLGLTQANNNIATIMTTLQAQANSLAQLLSKPKRGRSGADEDEEPPTKSVPVVTD